VNKNPLWSDIHDMRHAACRYQSQDSGHWQGSNDRFFLFFSSEDALIDDCTLASCMLIHPSSSTLHQMSRSDPRRKLFVFNEDMLPMRLAVVDAVPGCTAALVIASLPCAKAGKFNN
jgi:hypothetical protein